MSILKDFPHFNQSPAKTLNKGWYIVNLLLSKCVLLHAISESSQGVKRAIVVANKRAIDGAFLMMKSFKRSEVGDTVFPSEYDYYNGDLSALPAWVNAYFTRWFLPDKQSLTLEEQACNFVTFRHIERVRNLLNDFVRDLLKRGEFHDQSKLEPPEVALFTEMTSKLAECTYGSDEYKGYLKKLGPALEHHYAKNAHHPEHYKQGVNDMSLNDLVEMLVDWKAASERHNDGNILKSIEKNADRFSLSPQLVKILENTAKAAGW